MDSPFKPLHKFLFSSDLFPSYNCSSLLFLLLVLEDYLIELTNELKRLEGFEENSDILDNITYIVELVSKMTPM